MHIVLCTLTPSSPIHFSYSDERYRATRASNHTYPLAQLKKQTRTHLTNRTATTQREHRTMHTHPFESDSLLLLRRAIQTGTWMADGRTSKRLSTLTASQRSRDANKVNADRWIDCLRFPKDPAKATSKRR
ncbi:hypothetical protein GN958_ATG14819 [Phytophthora infestans]|uniref:Uncharacterized protein n=1 Tax=Phytophthora infestans TaxID=4787 RepID=A0A8S9U8W2_PHYIN|nr:hypothetical protein GN958_ATG14819 [Phytophthora infestans]